MYKICLLTKSYAVCDIEAGSDGSGAGGRAASNWQIAPSQRLAGGGNPKTACNPVDCDLPYGPQLPRPLVDLSSGKNWAFELVDLPPDVEPGVCLVEQLAASNWQLAKETQ